MLSDVLEACIDEALLLDVDRIKALSESFAGSNVDLAPLVEDGAKFYGSIVRGGLDADFQLLVVAARPDVSVLQSAGGEIKQAKLQYRSYL